MAQYDIFVSHSHFDTEFCLRLISAIYARIPEADIFFDETEMHGGDDWFDRIQREVIERAIFIVILSPQSVAASWVREETRLALYEAIRNPTLRWVIPVKFRDSNPRELAPILALRHFVDCTVDEEKGFDSLVTAIADTQKRGHGSFLPGAVRDRGTAQLMESALKSAADIDTAFQQQHWPYIAVQGEMVLSLPGNSDNADLNAQVGYALLQLSGRGEGDAKLQRAIELLDTACDLSPQRPDLRTWKARALAKRGDIQSALSTWSQALLVASAYHRKVAIFEEMFDAARAAGMLDKARDYADAVVSFLPMVDDGGDREIWRHWANQCQQIGYVDRVAELLDLAVERYPDDQGLAQLRASNASRLQASADKHPSPATENAVGILVSVLNQLNADKRYRDFPTVNTRLQQQGVRYKDLAFGRLSDFLRFAESQGAASIDWKRQVVVLPGEPMDRSPRAAPTKRTTPSKASDSALRGRALRLMDFAEKSLPYVTLESLISKAKSEKLPRVAIEQLIASGLIITYRSLELYDASGAKKSFDSLRLDRRADDVTQLYRDDPASWALLDDDEKRVLVGVLSALTRDRPLITWNNARTMLHAETAAVDWVVTLASAVDLNVVKLSDIVTEHKETGKPFTLRTITLNEDHPDVRRLKFLEQKTEAARTSGVLAWLRGRSAR